MYNLKEKAILNLPHDYFVFIDENGNSAFHIDPKVYDNPSISAIFTLTALIVPNNAYRDIMMPRIDDIKQEFFNNKDIYFHSHSIRRNIGPFKIFLNKHQYGQFKARMDSVIQESAPTFVSFSIDKRLLIDMFLSYQDSVGAKVYLNDMVYLMEFVGLLDLMKQFLGSRTAKIIFETIGKRESKRIQSVLHYQVDNNLTETGVDRDVLFFTKQDNINGLQMVDYCSYPFFRHANNNNDPDNKFFDVLEPYVYKDHSSSGIREWI